MIDGEQKILTIKVGIGVTGHRRIDHPAEISTIVRRVLGDIRKEWTVTNRSSSSGVSPTLVAISPLAEGADRLVAREIKSGRLRLSGKWLTIVWRHRNELEADKSK